MYFNKFRSLLRILLTRSKQGIIDLWNDFSNKYSCLRNTDESDLFEVFVKHNDAVHKTDDSFTFE